MYWISYFLFKLFGWKWEVPDVSKTPKLLVVVVPHTSNWDFPIGVLLRPLIKLDIKFLGKSSLFKPPFGWIFRALGGYPVDRSGNVKFVDAVVRLLNSKDKFLIAMSPEGTRKKVDRLRSGFYYIALTANIPIMLCKFDWENKHVGFSEAFMPSGDYQKDLKILEDYFRGVKGKIPEFGWQKNKNLPE